MIEERLAFEEFLIDNPDLERLESLLDEFNIFEALGAFRGVVILATDGFVVA